MTTPPSRGRRIAEALVTSQPAVTTFLLAPLGLLRPRSPARMTAPVIRPPLIVRSNAHTTHSFGLQHTSEVYTAATWLNRGHEGPDSSLPVVLAAIL